MKVRKTNQNVFSKRAEGEVKKLFMIAILLVAFFAFAWWKWMLSSPLDLRTKAVRNTTYTVVGIVDKIASKGDWAWYRLRCKTGHVWIKTLALPPSEGSAALVCGVFEGKEASKRQKREGVKWGKFWLVENFRMPLFVFFAELISK